VTRRFPFSVKRVEKVHFASDWTSDWTTPVCLGIITCTT
jgi:hypothetical protein